MKTTTLFAIIAVLALCSALPASADDPNEARTIVLDEDTWVVFYDLPSRRFTEVRSNFVKRRFDLAAADLFTSANYLLIESGRASPEISVRLSEVADQLFWIAGNMDDPDVTGERLDAQFGRAHWLLAQHYLEKARELRDLGLLRQSGLRLLATTHHLERAVLWSNYRIDRKLHGTLEELRDLAMRMQDEKQAQKAMNDRPIVRAEKFLRELGALIDRPVVMAQ
jgi:hypothetical protein